MYRLLLIYVLLVFISFKATAQTAVEIQTIDPNYSYGEPFKVDLDNKGFVIFDAEFRFPKMFGSGENSFEVHTLFRNIEKDDAERFSEDGKYKYKYDLVNYYMLEEMPISNQAQAMGGRSMSDSYTARKQYGLRGYLVEPGTYVLGYCASNTDVWYVCPSHHWKANGVKVGFLYFKVLAGEVLSLGRLSIYRSDIHELETEISIVDNTQESISYLKQKYPYYVNRLETRLFNLSKADSNNILPKIPPELPLGLILQLTQ
jgi:hypothetical protein